jgi:hypothetical protein
MVRKKSHRDHRIIQCVGDPLGIRTATKLKKKLGKNFELLHRRFVKKLFFDEWFESSCHLREPATKRFSLNVGIYKFYVGGMKIPGSLSRIPKYKIN